MAFIWKKREDMFKGEGIYHLTWAVVNRVPILGALEPLPMPDADGPVRQAQDRHTAWVRATGLGKAVLAKMNELEVRNPEIEIIWKTLMPDHLHAVIWAHEGFEDSIKMVARGYGQGCSKIARGFAARSVEDAQSDCGKTMNRTAVTTDSTATDGPTDARDPYDCGNGTHTLFSTPFIRTLSHKGQLDKMVKYVKSNPDNAWMRRLHPDLYVIRRNMEYAGLHFDTMGKARLLAYPDRQVIALSRSLTDEDIQHEVNKALLRAEAGQVTLTGAMNKGEQKVAKAIREAGYPLVVMLMDGFPPEGSEAAKYYHPGGVYHQACGEGQLYLMAPLPDNYSDPVLIARTEAELARKAAEKGKRYYGIPHTSTRWRMIAGNVMLEMIANDNDNNI